MRRRNVSVVEKLQEEFKRFFEQMDLMFVLSEKMVMKVMVEVNELRMQKCEVEEMFKKVNDEYEVKFKEFFEKLSQMERYEEDVILNLN